MKKSTVTLLLLLMVSGTNILAQQNTTPYEKYGNTLNLGIGLGYYGYVGHAIPVLHADYEFDVARNFTLAPFIAYYSYQDYNYWGDANNPYRNYYYRETVVPVGVKGSYYFDRLLNANKNWDFYLAASLGFSIMSTTWDNGYNGNRTINTGTGDLYLDLHIGTEYHLNKKTGLFLDLSTGVSTFGVAIHF